MGPEKYQEIQTSSGTSPGPSRPRRLVEDDVERSRVHGSLPSVLRHEERARTAKCDRTAWYKKKQLLTSLTAVAFLSTRASHKRNPALQDIDSTDTSFHATDNSRGKFNARSPKPATQKIEIVTYNSRRIH
jgi:hypothetical protein